MGNLNPVERQPTNNVLFWLFCISRLFGIHPQTKVPAEVDDVTCSSTCLCQMTWHIIHPDLLLFFNSSPYSYMWILSVLPAQWRGTSWTTQRHPSLRRRRPKSRSHSARMMTAAFHLKVHAITRSHPGPEWWTYASPEWNMPPKSPAGLSICSALLALC